MFPVREDEPNYAKLHDPVVQEANRYETPIELVPDGSGGVSLRINGDDSIGTNPNRTKQHAFHFTADNCIGCHACEAACSEKNDLPAHLAFRSVGYVEGGTYPDYTRMNISMACNHCDDPVCLKGCPTRAYTKHAEYGAVIQDPDICFGCGYCTWVCPYNAPQLDPVKGQVEKCNMCVDRLEVGLKPACVSACLGNALDFGVVENMPDNREQIETTLPGFPDPSITQPNIRFQQVKTMPREMARTDSMPVKYHQDEKGAYKPVIDQKVGVQKHWNLKKLSSRENPLVVLTLGSQAAIGGFLLLMLGQWFSIPGVNALTQSVVYTPIIVALLGLSALGMLMSATHLGKPLRFYRGFNNLRHSPLAREAFGLFCFLILGGVYLLSSLPAAPWVQSLITLPAVVTETAQTVAEISSVLTLAAGGAGLYFMYRAYRIKARPFWDHHQTGFSFVGTCFSLGSIVIAAFAVPYALFTDADLTLLPVLALTAAAGMSIEAIGLFLHARDMNRAEHEGAASHYIQSTTFGYSYLTRNGLLGFSLLAMLALTGVTYALPAIPAMVPTLGFAAVAVLAIVGAVIGRALFYVLVIPTTMPGAFFWKNKAFEQHAKDIGLANMPQVGVVPDSH